jgi:L-cysteine S-thiosulfotransferase
MIDRLKKTTAVSALVATVLVAGCATDSAKQANGDGAMREKAIAMIKRDFQPKGIAGLERLNEDPVQALCNKSHNMPQLEEAQLLQKDLLAGIKLPADGNYMGDWKEGEKLAQSGRGFTWTDQPGLPVGGNCYNCHQISPKELSFGTVGPNLYQFGKNRGNGPDVQKYVYSKIFNSKAFLLCSEMPRFGAIGALQEKQIKDLVALLLDPESPVNK